LLSLQDVAYAIADGIEDVQRAFDQPDQSTGSAPG
jgi:hypothetical protein